MPNTLLNFAKKSTMDNRFTEIIKLIEQSRSKAIRAVNTELINLYWLIGENISKKLNSAEWGDSVVTELANYIKKIEPNLKGFSDKNIWRMKQFYEAYKGDLKLSTLLREISWSHNLAIFSRCKNSDERLFYLEKCINENYSFRELERQISSSLFERTMIGNSKLSPPAREILDAEKNVFKDSYVFEFLSLPEPHSEADLQKGLLRQMKNFIVELGKDFIFIGEEFKLQVGASDFYVDLLFFHRGLQCLIAIELKADKFRPEHIGQLNFYLEALDRDVKKPNENPSIGILLCKDKDNEVVEYSLSRNLSTTMVSEYKTQLPEKRILQNKLKEISDKVDNL